MRKAGAKMPAIVSTETVPAPGAADVMRRWAERLERLGRGVRDVSAYPAGVAATTGGDDEESEGYSDER